MKIVSPTKENFYHHGLLKRMELWVSKNAYRGEILACPEGSE